MQITGLGKSLKQTTGVSLILPLTDKYPRWFLLGFFPRNSLFKPK